MAAKKACKAIVRKQEKREFYDRKELEKLALQSLDMNIFQIRKLKKKELCKLLKIEWIDNTKKQPKQTTIITDEKICTNYACTKAFPNRLSKTELVDMVKKKNPRYSKSALRLKKTHELCRLLQIRFVECPESDRVPPPVSARNGRGSKLTDMPPVPADIATRSCVSRSGLPLQPQQLKVVEYLQNHRGVLMYHTVGSGKTLTAITISQCFLDAFPQKKVIVVTPASLIENFKLQMTYYKNIKYPEKYSFFSFQAFVRAKKSGRIPCNDVLLIVDEAHNLKTNPRKVNDKMVGIQSKIITDCAEKAFRVLLLSATPVINSPKDLVPLYNMMRDRHEPKMVVSFGKNQATSPRFVKYSAPELARYMRCKVSFFDAVDKRYYPTLKEHNVFLRMTPSYEQKYDNLLQKEKGGLSALAIRQFGDIDIEKFYNGYRRAVNTLESKESPKIQWVLDKINGLDKNEKIIIFSHFLEAGNLAIQKNLSATQKRKSAYIRGGTPKKQRADIVQKYNSGQIQILFISKAGGEGLDLKGTTFIVILEPSWNRSLEDQIIGRGVRYKSHESLPLSKRKVNVYRLFLVKQSDLQYKNVTIRSEKDDLPVKFNPQTNSVDILMRFLQLRKEQRLETIRKIIVDGAIENAYCEDL